MENNVQIQHSPRHSKKTLFASLPLFISLLAITTPFSSAFADTEYKVQSGDSLSKIIAKNYPDVARQSYGIIMQHTLKNNPDAFSNKNINSLRLGKTLTLTAKEDIEGLKPKPPAPTPVNPEEFKKLQSQNSELEKQLQALKSELEKLQNTSTEPANTTTNTSTDDSSTETDTANQEKINPLQEKVDQLTAQVKKLETEKQALAEKTTDTTEQTAELTAAKTLTEQLQNQIATLKAENAELSKVDKAATEKQLSDSQAEITQLKEQLATLEAKNAELSKIDTASTEKQLADSQNEITQLKEQLATLKAEKEDQAKTSEELIAANKQVEELQAKVEQLNTQISELKASPKEETQQATTSEADTNKLEEMQAELTFLQGLVDKNEADMEEKDTQIKQLEEKLAALGGTTENAEDTTSTASDAQLEKLQQENSQLQAEINKAIEKASQDNNTINQLKADLAAAATAKPPTTAPQTPAASTATEAQSQPEPSTWLKLSILSWLLPLLAILIGLYLLSRLIKRKRDKQAAEDFKTAMATSASSNTAAAFGIDGSAPAPHTSSDAESGESITEEDSLEAGVKIDIAKAYIELNETDAANEMLQEAMIEGSSSQKEAAEKLLK